jgi:PD-(D/E)XK nuclease superfamily
MFENEITHHIIGCAIKIHRAFGPGLLASAYEARLYYIKLLDFRLGLLINFNVVKLTDGIRRVANNFK